MTTAGNLTAAAYFNYQWRLELEFAPHRVPSAAISSDKVATVRSRSRETRTLAANRGVLMKMALLRIPETVIVPERAHVKSWRLIDLEVKHDSDAKLNQREAKFNIALLRFLMVIYICADP